MGLGMPDRNNPPPPLSTNQKILGLVFVAACAAIFFVRSGCAKLTRGSANAISEAASNEGIEYDRDELVGRIHDAATDCISKQLQYSKQWQDPSFCMEAEAMALTEIEIASQYGLVDPLIEGIQGKLVSHRVCVEQSVSNCTVSNEAAKRAAERYLEEWNRIKRGNDANALTSWHANSKNKGYWRKNLANVVERRFNLRTNRY